jgi:hypothetical protein
MGADGALDRWLSILESQRVLLDVQRNLVEQLNLVEQRNLVEQPDRVRVQLSGRSRDLVKGGDGGLTLASRLAGQRARSSWALTRLLRR